MEKQITKLKLLLKKHIDKILLGVLIASILAIGYFLVQAGAS